MSDRAAGAIDPTLIETLADAAWPAAEVAPLGPWRTRATEGVTRRANSVFTAGGGPPAGDEMRRLVDAAERFYARRGLPPCFQISAATGARGLDALLAARGYVIDGASEVWTADAQDLAPNPEGGTVAELRGRDDADDGWLGCAFDEPPERRRVHEQIVRRVTGPRRFVSAIIDGQVVGCGLAVSDRGHAGLFRMTTRAGHRRQGIGRAMVRSLCAWAVGRGDLRLYLQVTHQNAAAKALYSRAGFARAYGYHYRTR
jgi:ribosomal protein S18 acetylase RimI-like enzyme